MRKLLASLLILLLAAPVWADGFKTRKQLQQENEKLRQQVQALEAEIAVYRSEASEQEEIAEEIAEENENKVSAALQDYNTQTSTDTLLGQWYLHRQST